MSSPSNEALRQVYLLKAQAAAARNVALAAAAELLEPETDLAPNYREDLQNTLDETNHDQRLQKIGRLQLAFFHAYVEAMERIAEIFGNFDPDNMDDLQREAAEDMKRRQRR